MRDGSETRPGEGAPLSLDELQAALALERARVREVEHRAKNSLQLVCSLLQLLGRRSPHEETRATLKSLQQRIGAIAAVHRDFMDADQRDRFDLTRMVREQASAVAESLGEGASVRLDLDPVTVDPAKASAFALIVCELILNALRHGRRDGAPPMATVQLRRDGDRLVLTVADEGPGPAALAAPGFGLTMLRLLVQQVGGTYALEDAQPGLRVVVKAP